MSVTEPQVAQSPAPLASSDETLVGHVRTGQAASAEELVRRYYQPLQRYLHRLCGNEQVAEELQQQTWLSVLEHLPTFDAASAQGGFKAWLFRIATNKANDYWRSQGRQRLAHEGLRFMTDLECPGASHRLEGHEQVQKLQRAVEQLPEPQRQVLLLRYYGNLKFVEIAQLLGCPLNTALGRMHKAILRLKEMMER